MVDYIQADIEGAEAAMLRGAHKVLQRCPNVRLAVCCYHTAVQEREVTTILDSLCLAVRPSDGFVLMWMQYLLRKPYLRRAVLYVWRPESALKR